MEIWTTSQLARKMAIAILRKCWGRGWKGYLEMYNLNYFSYTIWNRNNEKQKDSS